MKTLDRLCMDTDEVRIISEGSQWVFLYRIANTDIFMTDNNVYDTTEEALAGAIINLALARSLVSSN